MKHFLFVICLLFVFSCNNKSADNNNTADDNNNPPPPLINYSVVKVYPHDTSSYTQGLELYNNTLYEGTGNYEYSKVLKTDLSTGKILQQVKTSNDSVFGEGITIFNGKLYELTWRTKKVYVYDLNTFKRLNEFDWPFEGWGLTNNGKELIVSTGSSNIYFVDPNSFKILRQVSVTDNNGPVSNLNELEYVHGFIYSNIYETDYIIKIDPETGNVVGKVDCSNILSKNGITVNTNDFAAKGYVLNGIAYDSTKNIFYITGKQWPALFEVKFN